MKSYTTTLLFAFLSADKLVQASSFAPSDLTGDEGCIIDQTEESHDVFDVDQACCHLYTEPHFSGDRYEICNTSTALPAEFIVKGIDSWVCGPYTEVAFTEGNGKEGHLGYQTFASSSESYIFNEDISASKSPLHQNFS